MKHVVLLSAVLLAAQVAAAASPDSPLRITLSAGATLPGFVDASWEQDFPEDVTVRFSTTVCPLAKAAADYYLIPNLGPSISVHYALFLLREDLDLGNFYAPGVVVPRAGVHFLEVEAGIKGRLGAQRGIGMDAGVYLGFGRTLSTTPEARDSGLILDLVTSIRLQQTRPEIVLTMGIMAQLYGGVEGVAWIRSLPFFYGVVGVGLP